MGGGDGDVHRKKLNCSLTAEAVVVPLSTCTIPPTVTNYDETVINFCSTIQRDSQKCIRTFLFMHSPLQQGPSVQYPVPTWTVE